MLSETTTNNVVGKNGHTLQDVQLSACRSEAAQISDRNRNSENARTRLEGFVAVAQDWHAGQCFLERGTPR